MGRLTEPLREQERVLMEMVIPVPIEIRDGKMGRAFKPLAGRMGPAGIMEMAMADEAGILLKNLLPNPAAAGWRK